MLPCTLLSRNPSNTASWQKLLVLLGFFSSQLLPKPSPARDSLGGILLRSRSCFRRSGVRGDGAALQTTWYDLVCSGTIRPRRNSNSQRLGTSKAHSGHEWGSWDQINSSQFKQYRAKLVLYKEPKQAGWGEIIYSDDSPSLSHTHLQWMRT